MNRYYKANEYFALVRGPYEKKQHPNQQKGLDLYVDLIHLVTGENCTKKLYQSTKGIYFNHTGYSTMYLDDMTERVKVQPYHYEFVNPGHEEYPKYIVLFPEDAKLLGQKYGHPEISTPYVGDPYVVFVLEEVKDD